MWRTDSMNWRCLALAITVAVMIGSSVTAQVYKSVDESGKTVYSDTAPTTGAVEKVQIEPAPAESDVERTQTKVKETNRVLDELAAEREQKKAEKAVAKQENERRNAACAAARIRLEQFTLQPPNRRLVMQPDGSSRRVNWDEMQSMIAQASSQVEQDRKGC